MKAAVWGLFWDKDGVRDARKAHAEDGGDDDDDDSSSEGTNNRRMLNEQRR